MRTTSAKWRTIAALLLSFLSVASTQTVGPSLQINFVGTQMASYVHRPLLNKYAAYRSMGSFVTIHEFSNVATGLPYDPFFHGVPCIDPRFSSIEGNTPAFLADTAMNKTTTVPPPYLSLPVFLYELAIVYNLGNSITTSQMELRLSQTNMLKLFTGQITKWGDLNLA